MIEVLLEAEQALSFGLLDQAERLYRQAADGDPRNSIAVVGLARVALERGDDARALALAERALTIDADNLAAQRLATRLREVRAHRGIVDAPGPEGPDGIPPSTPSPAAAPPGGAAPASGSAPPPRVEEPTTARPPTTVRPPAAARPPAGPRPPTTAGPAAAGQPKPPVRRRRRGLLRRLLGRG